MRIKPIMTLVAVLTPAFALAGCSGGEEAASSDAAEEMAAAAAEGPQPQPGQYRTTAELLEFNVPGAPPEAADMMRSAFSQGAAEGNTYCLTPEQAATSREDMLKNMAESDCTVSRFDMSAGRFDAALSCPSGQGVAGNVTMTGTMSETGSDMEMAFTTEVPGAGTATIRMHMVSERIGDCS